jgi:hypothetical protein
MGAQAFETRRLIGIIDADPVATCVRAIMSRAQLMERRRCHPRQFPPSCCSARSSPQPVFDPKIRDPREFVLIISHHGVT